MQIPTIENGLKYANPGWLFYRNQFENLLTVDDGKTEQPNFEYLLETNPDKKKSDKARNDEIFEKHNKRLSGQKYPIAFGRMVSSVSDKEAYKPIRLKTIYPGLLLGSGYSHETGSKEEYKLGFFFDHASGMPIIPGSSVKGTIRSVFPNFHNPRIKHQAEKASVVWQLLNKVDGITFPLPERKEDSSSGNYWADLKNEEVWLVNALERVLFDGTLHSFESSSTELPQAALPKRLSVYQRDIFHDAVVVSFSGGKLFGSDFITPHINRQNPDLSAFSDPIPLQFLKVMPEVVFQFEFEFKSTVFELNEGKVIEVTANHKRELCQSIIEMIGVGAKTNVGYGQFVELTQEETGAIDRQKIILEKKRAEMAKGDGVAIQLDLRPEGYSGIIHEALSGDSFCVKFETDGNEITIVRKSESFRYEDGSSITKLWDLLAGKAVRVFMNNKFDPASDKELDCTIKLIDK